MKNIRILTLIAALGLFSLTSCVKDNFNELDDTIQEEINTSVLSELEISELEIPDSFQFETEKQVSVNISDASDAVAYSITLDNNVLFSGTVKANTLNASISLPSYVTEVTLYRRTVLSVKKLTVAVQGNSITYNN